MLYCVSRRRCVGPHLLLFLPFVSVYSYDATLLGHVANWLSEPPGLEIGSIHHRSTEDRREWER